MVTSLLTFSAKGMQTSAFLAFASRRRKVCLRSDMGDDPPNTDVAPRITGQRAAPPRALDTLEVKIDTGAGEQWEK